MLDGGVLGLILGLPEAPTVIFAVCFAMGLGYLLLRYYTKTLTVEVAALRKALADQAERHARALAEQAERHAAQFAGLEARFDAMVAKYDHERSQKHDVVNQLAIAKGTLTVAARLLTACTCNAFDSIAPLIAPYTPEAT